MRISFSIIIVVFCLLFVQNRVMSQYLKGEFGHFFIGNSFLQSRHLNLMELDRIPRSSLMIGGGGFGTLKNILIGGDGGLVTANSFQTSGFGDVRQSVGFGLIKFGYLTSFAEGTVFYPTIGIGGGGTMLQLDEKSDDERMYFTRQTLFNLELNFDIYLNLTEQGFNGLKVGVSMGYLFNPISRSWNQLSGEALGLPNAMTDGFYIRMTIGGGGIEKSKIMTPSLNTE
jgi:hypothetical protein